MFKSSFLFKQRYFLRILFLQFILLSGLYIYIYITYKFFVFSSVVYGGIVGIVPSLLFFYVFFNGKVVSPERIVKTFYLASIFKMVSFIIMCFFIFSISFISPGWFFLSLFFIQIVFWCNCVLFFNEGISLYECGR